MANRGNSPSPAFRSQKQASSRRRVKKTGIVMSMSLNLQEDRLGHDNLSGPLPQHLQQTHSGEKDQGRRVHKSPAEQVRPPPSTRRHRREKLTSSDLLIWGPGGLRGVGVICLQKRGLGDPRRSGLDSVVGNGNGTFCDHADHLELTRRKVPFPKHYYRSSPTGPRASATLSVSCAKMANGSTSAALSRCFITPRTTAALFGCLLPN